MNSTTWIVHEELSIFSNLNYCMCTDIETIRTDIGDSGDQEKVSTLEFHK